MSLSVHELEILMKEPGSLRSIGTIDTFDTIGEDIVLDGWETTALQTFATDDVEYFRLNFPPAEYCPQASNPQGPQPLRNLPSDNAHASYNGSGNDHRIDTAHTSLPLEMTKNISTMSIGDSVFDNICQNESSSNFNVDVELNRNGGGAALWPGDADRKGQPSHGILPLDGLVASPDAIHSQVDQWNVINKFDSNNPTMLTIPPLNNNPRQTRAAMFENNTSMINDMNTRHNLPTPIYHDDVQLDGLGGGATNVCVVGYPRDPPQSPHRDSVKSGTSLSKGKARKVVENYTENDVLVVGGGGGQNKHEDHVGNQTYKSEIARQQELYLSAVTDKERNKVRLALINWVKGRDGYFLKPNGKDETNWIELDGKSIRTQVEKDLKSKIYVQDITENDVLGGRGALGNHHLGNQVYLAERDRMRPAYLAATNEAEKHHVSQELVDWVTRQNGRFLTEDDQKKWFILDNKNACAKARQALIDGRKL